MRIGIDCRLSGLTHAGIGRYIENLTRRLPKLAPNIEWVYFYHHAEQIIPGLKIKAQVVPIRHYTFREQLQLGSIFNQAELDLLHVPHFNAPLTYSGKLVATIHDLLWHQQKGAHATTLKPWQYWGKYLGYKLVATKTIHQAAQIIVPTRTIQQTLASYYPHTQDKVTVTYEGIDERLLQYQDLKVKRHKKSLLYVGSLYPHKNIRLVIQALAQLPHWQLVIVGARDAFQAQVRHQVEKAGVIKQVEFKGYLSDKKLAREIKATTALVQPSLSEGFGLTGVEALALGAPVLASNIPVFKEIYQDLALYFNPHSVDSFLESISELKNKKTNRQEQQQLIELYSWNRLAKKTLQLYQSLS